MTPIGPPHSACVAALTRILTLGIAERGIVWVQSPVAIPAYSKPQPTWPWSARARTAQRIRRPTTSCCSSRSPIRRYATDRTIKRDVYARAGIHECWIVDTATETVEVFRSPTAAGYGEARRVARDGTIAPSAFPDVTVRVPELFT